MAVGGAANYKIAHQDRKYIKLTSLRIGNRIHAIADQMLQSTRHIKHYITCSRRRKKKRNKRRKHYYIDFACRAHYYSTNLSQFIFFAI